MVIRAARSLVVVSNVQEHMRTILDCGESFFWNNCWIVALAKRLGIPVVIMEHKGLDETVAEISDVAGDSERVEITTFSYISNPATRKAINAYERDQLIFCGTETHISIFQSAVEAKEAGFTPFVLGEACGARDRDDHSAALTRLQQNGVEVVTREMVLFEWMESSVDGYREASIQFLKHPHPFPQLVPVQ